MRRLKQVLWLGQKSGAFPWKWDAKTSRIEKWSAFFEKIWCYQWAIVLVQTVFLSVFHLNVFWNAIKAAEAYRTAFQSTFSPLWFSYSLIFNGNVYYYKERVRTVNITAFGLIQIWNKKLTYIFLTSDLPKYFRPVINLNIFT